jgi:hypothetical protein
MAAARAAAAGTVAADPMVAVRTAAPTAAVGISDAVVE